MTPPDRTGHSHVDNTGSAPKGRATRRDELVDGKGPGLGARDTEEQNEVFVPRRRPTLLSRPSRALRELPLELGETSRRGKGGPVVFISYSHKDNRWLDRLQVFLAPIERAGTIHRWDDTRIDAGGIWRVQVRRAIESAHVAILLISADYLASEYVQTNELPAILTAAHRRGLRCLPVLVGPCSIARHPQLSNFQVVNKRMKPLVKMRLWEREELWARLAELVYELFD